MPGSRYPSVRRALGGLVLALLAALLVATPASANATVAGTITISGDVTTPVNGTAWFIPEPNPSGSYSGINFTGGSFTTTSFADGPYKIRISLSTMDGYSRYYREGFPEGTTDVSLATTVTLGGGPAPTIDIVFPQIATVSGQVTNGDGNPMAGVVVLRNKGGSVRSTTTDGTGHYSLGYHLAGPVAIGVNGNGTWAEDRKQVTVPASGALTVDLLMDRPVRISGTVTDAGTGTGIPHLRVTALEMTGTTAYRQVETDADGAFDIIGLPDGEYVVRYEDYPEGYPTAFNDGGIDQATAPRLVAAAGQHLVQDDALTQRPDPRLGPHTLGGVVVDQTDAALAGIEVVARSGTDSLVTTTDRSGRWAIDAPVGDYTLRAASSFWLQLQEPDLVPWFPEYYPEAWDEGSATPVPVTTGSQADLPFQLARAARLTTSVSGPGGLLQVDTGYRILDAATGSVKAEVAPAPFAGNLVQVLVPAGSWKVLVSGRRSDTDRQLLSRWYGGGTSAATAPALTVVAGQDVAGSGTVLAGALKAVTAPRVQGRPAAGKKLKVTKGTWNLMTDTTFAFRWLRGSTVLSKTASYVVRRADLGATLKVKVTAKNGELATPVVLKVKVPA